MTINPRLIKSSLEAIEPIADKVVGHFYAVLFLLDPALRDLFPVAMDAQRDRLFQSLLRIGRDVENLAALTTYLQQLGRDHRKYGVRPGHYTHVGTALMTALARYAGDLWTEDLQTSWGEAYQLAATVMIEAADEQAQQTPAFWHGRVIRHEPRGSDVAVLTIEPDQPLPYLAGQYISVQTLRWPRVWRHYSIANRPRKDHTLELHVRAVPAGWVSSALVYHTTMGDTVRLGSALGTMVLDDSSTRQILCIGGGTGISPIKAMVEEMTRSDQPRSMQVFFGVRRLNDLYDLGALTRLALRHRWLTVVPVVSDEPGYPGLTGPVVEVATDLANWEKHEVYLCGPPPMVRTGLTLLEQAGIAPAQLHFDPWPDL
jgi:NAD(P)H-flavin reductase/hemoglobin-like flavoprotein